MIVINMRTKNTFKECATYSAPTFLGFKNNHFLIKCHPISPTQFVFSSTLLILRSIRADSLISCNTFFAVGPVAVLIALLPSKFFYIFGFGTLSACFGHSLFSPVVTLHNHRLDQEKEVTDFKIAIDISN